MDAALITLVAIMALPIVAILALRINAALVFMALCLGSVLTQFVADDAGWLMTLAAPNVPQAGSVTESTVKLALLLLPTVLTAVFMIRTVSGSRQILNALPAVGVGLLGALLIVPMLPAGTSIPILASPLWQEVVKLQDLIVGSSALVCLLVLWMQRPKTGHHEGKHGKHHV